MEGLPEIGERVRLPLKIRILPYLMDHHFQGKTVLPAVEAMRSLAASVLSHAPGVDVRAITNVSFDRFLHIDPGAELIDAFNEMETGEDGDLWSSLITRTRSRNGKITRTKEHVSLRFSAEADPSPPPLDLLSALGGVGFAVPCEALYSDLVPFGPHYQNVTGILWLSEEGALGTVHAPDNDAPCAPLGSPFPFDAALHAACAWGQRYRGVVGFPAALEYRRIFRRTVPGTDYFVRVIPRGDGRRAFSVDIWVYSGDGTIHESAQGVLMREVGPGKIKPPPWIVEGREDQGFPWPKNGCEALAVLELDTVNSVAPRTLSEAELGRYARMGDRRRRSYLGARLCCKSLSRELSGNDMLTPASDITTIRSDQVRPRVPLTDGTDPFFCSVSHDGRFAVAVAARTRLGVDVEEISERALRAGKTFLKKGEEILVMNSSLEPVEASIRIWSIKEAMSKIFGMGLARSWERAEVKEVGKNKSLVMMDQVGYIALHHTVENHVFTLIFGDSSAPGYALQPQQRLAHR